MTNTSKFYQMIESGSEDARFDAWMGLYRSTAEADRQEILLIISRNDPVLKILFCRFLSALYERAAIEYIVMLLRDDNPDVSKSAKLAFEKNKYTDKNSLLIPLLSGPPSAAKLFAIEELSLARRFEIVSDLTAMFDPKDETMLITLLSAFRHLPDRSVVPLIDELVYDKREEIRFRTLLVYAALDENNLLYSRNMFAVFLRDMSPRIRLTTLWAMRKNPAPSDIPILRALSRKDPDIRIRLECITNLGAFPTRAVISHILSLCETEKSVVINLKAESTLLSMPPEALARGLMPNIKHKNTKIRNRALLMLSVLRINTRKIFSTLRHGLLRARTDQDRVPYIEALGALGEPVAIPLLEGMVRKSPLLAYTAMMALLKIYSDRDTSKFAAYLDDPDLNILVKQNIMRHLIRVGTPAMYDETLTAALRRFLPSDNMQMRYLASEALAHARRFPIFDDLYAAYAVESDAHTALSMLDNLIAISLADVDVLLKAIRSRMDSASDIDRLLDIYRRACALNTRFALGATAALLRPPFCLLDSPHQAVFLEVLLDQLTTKKITFKSLIERACQPHNMDAVIASLVQKLTRHPHYQLNLPFGHIAEWLDTKPPEIVTHVITLMGYSAETKALLMLSEMAHQERWADYRATVGASLKKTLEASHD